MLLLAGNVTLSDHRATSRRRCTLVRAAARRSSFFIFLIAAFAETNRLPFDLPEAESELIAGYHTEYSAMKFSHVLHRRVREHGDGERDDGDALLRRLGHPVHARGTTSAPHTVVKTLLTLVHLLAQDRSFFIFFFIWIRWTLPRFRYDQLMALGWKVMLPLALAYIVDRRRRRCSALDARGHRARARVRLARCSAVNVVLRGPRVRRCSTAGASSARRTRRVDARSSRGCARSRAARASSQPEAGPTDGNRREGARAPDRADVSYVRATLKGMALTFKHLFDPQKVTMQYPEEK